MELAAAGAPRHAVAVANANYAELPMDVLYEILLCLPADEVCRLRLVCRSWRSLTSDPLFVSAHASRRRAPNVIVVVGNHDDDDQAAPEVEVRAVDLDGNVVKRSRIRRPIGRLSVHGDLLCASHGWGLTGVFDMVTGDVADMAAEYRKKVNSATPQCVLGHVPATGEYKVLRLQADYLSRRRRQRCEVMTLAGEGDAGMWRLRTPPPVTLSIEPGSSSWNVAVVAGLAYFLVCRGPQDDEFDGDVEADSIAVFDLAAEEWKPAILIGPLTCSLLANAAAGDDVTMPYRRRPPWWYCYEPLTRRFQLVARLGDSLVVVYCNIEDSSTELWFMDAYDDDDGDDNTVAAPRWSRRYTLRCTAFGEDDEPLVHEYFNMCLPVQQYHYPLAVLDDGRILVWVDRTSMLRAYMIMRQVRGLIWPRWKKAAVLLARTKEDL